MSLGAQRKRHGMGACPWPALQTQLCVSVTGEQALPGCAGLCFAFQKLEVMTLFALLEYPMQQNFAQMRLISVPAQRQEIV